MKTRGMYLTLGVVLILGVLSYLDFSREQKEESKKGELAKLFNLNFDQVNQYTLIRPKATAVSTSTSTATSTSLSTSTPAVMAAGVGEDRVVLSRDVNGWNVVEPIQDIASNTEVENYLREVLEDKSLEVVKEGDSIPWQDYQLDHPQAVVKIKDQSGREESLQISAQENFEGRVYARRNSENRLITVGASWKNRASENNIRFRERKLFRGKLAAVKKIIVRLPGQDPVEILQDPEGRVANWIYPKDRGLVLDQNKVREWLTQISETKISNYLVNGKPTEKERREWGFTASVSGKEIHQSTSSDAGKSSKGRRGLVDSNVSKRISLQLIGDSLPGANKNSKTDAANIPPQEVKFDLAWSVELLQNKTKETFAVTSEPAFLVKLEDGQWDKFANLRLANLIDTKSLFAIERDKLTKVEVKKAGKSKVYLREGGQWNLLGADKAKSPSGETAYIESLMKNIEGIQIEDFAASEYINKVESTILLYGNQTDKPLVIEVGPGQGGVGKSVRQMRSSKIQKVLTISSELVL